jgi:hypothetical protein
MVCPFLAESRWLKTRAEWDQKNKKKPIPPSLLDKR